MEVGSTDGVMALLGSLLVSVLLILARQVVDARDVTSAAPPESTQSADDRTPDVHISNDRWTAENASTKTFKVIGVVDGDTIDILVDRKPLRLRLAGIDTPEKGQPFGNKAKQDLSSLIGGKLVSYEVRETDRYGRGIADIYIKGTHVNLWLVQQGLAWHYVAYSNDPVLRNAEEQAQRLGTGLWSDSRAVAPWNWRKLSKIERDAYR